MTVVEPPQIPKDLAGLQKYDGVVLSNVSSLKLTRQQMGTSATTSATTAAGSS